MPTMQDSTSVATVVTTANVLAGLLFENLPKNARVTLLATGSATGLRCTFLIGGIPAVNDVAIGLQNRFPIIPDDVVTRAFGVVGSKLFLTFRNPTGGTLTAFWSVIIE